MKYKISTSHTLEEYNKRYGKISYSLLKYSKNELKEYDHLLNSKNNYLLRNHQWWLIDDTYYEVPRKFSIRWFRSFKYTLNIAVAGLGAIVIGLGVAHAVRVLKPEYSVSFAGEQKDTHLVMVGNSKAKRGEDYKLKFNIDYNYELNLDNIHVYINGKERRDAWTFRYQTNVKNELTIKKECIHGDIKVKANAIAKTTTRFLFGIETDAYVNTNLDVKVYTGDEKKEVTKIPIAQLSGTEAYPVYEDDCVEAVFTLKAGIEGTISDRLWFRTNARYAKVKTDNDPDYDFEKIVSKDKKTVKFIVPHFIIRDCCDFRERPEL